MEPLYFWVTLLIGSSFAFPPTDYTQHAAVPQTPQTTGSSKQPEAPAEEREQVNTVRVTCHPDSLEVVIKADMFAVGAPVDAQDLRLGVEHNAYCTATASSGEEYSILVGLVDCGTKHWITEDSLVYTNLLIYSPAASPDGVVRMDEAVVPIECHYQRKYSLSSSSLTPTWIPFMSTQAAVETLDFDLKIMTDDWLYQRSSNVFYLGDPITMEASVRVGHHMGLRVFVSSCVATLYPDIYSVPRYIFVDNGCLVDSQLPGSRSQFLPRTQSDKLHLSIDAFRFHNEDKGELYITCHINAVPVNDAEAPNKACTSVNGRWRSADGNDYLCGHCQSQNEVGQTKSKASSPSKFGPRGFGKSEEPEPLWRSSLKANTVWEQEARVGPVVVLPAVQKSGPVPVEDVPPVLNKISRPALYGSKWRSGLNDRVDLNEKGQLPDSPSAPEREDIQTLDSEQNKDDKSVTDLKDEDSEEVSAPLEKLSPEASLKSKSAVLGSNSTSALDDVHQNAQLTLDVTTLSNANVTDSDLSDKDPKR